MMNQHLVRKAFRLRLAERSDLPALLALEEKAWQQLAASEEVRLVMVGLGGPWAWENVNMYLYIYIHIYIYIYMCI